MMMRKRVIQAGVGVLLLAVWLALGCAEPNTPGSDNVTSTGVVLRVTDISAADGATGNNETDVVLHLCPGGDFERGFFDVSMSVTLKNDSPGEGESQSTAVTITSYTIEYFSSETGAVPLPSENVVAQSFVIPSGQSFSYSGLLMSVDTKREFIDRGGDPGQMPTYEARVTFYGVNDFGYVVKARGSVYLEIADWDVC